MRSGFVGASRNICGKRRPTPPVPSCERTFPNTSGCRNPMNRPALAPALKPPTNAVAGIGTDRKRAAQPRDKLRGNSVGERRVKLQICTTIRDVCLTANEADDHGANFLSAAIRLSKLLGAATTSVSASNAARPARVAARG